MFGKLQCNIPPNEWKILCCVGDFNVKISKESPEKELLMKLSKLMGLKLTTPSTPTRGDSTIDYIIAGDKITAIEESLSRGPSDHLAVTWNLHIIANEKKKPKKNPSKSTAEEISLDLINNKLITKAEDFIQHFGYIARKKKEKL